MIPKDPPPVVITLVGGHSVDNRKAKKYGCSVSALVSYITDSWSDVTPRTAHLEKVEGVSGSGYFTKRGYAGRYQVETIIDFWYPAKKPSAIIELSEAKALTESRFDALRAAFAADWADLYETERRTRAMRHAEHLMGQIVQYVNDKAEVAADYQAKLAALRDAFRDAARSILDEELERIIASVDPNDFEPEAIVWCSSVDNIMTRVHKRSGIDFGSYGPTLDDIFPENPS